MLTKLLKYELKATGRILVPSYFALLVLALVNRIILNASNANQWDIPVVIGLLTYVIVVAAVAVVTLVLVIQRFYKNLLCEEGYLMFTLPVKPWQHITSKMLVAMVWTILSSIVANLSAFVIVFSFDDFNFNFNFNFLNELFKVSNLHPLMFCLEGIIIIFLALAASILILYASMALGHLFSQRRILASLGSFIVLCTLTQIVSFLALLGVGRLDFLFNPDLSSITEMHIAFLILIIFMTLISAIYFSITNYVLNKRLNLE